MQRWRLALVDHLSGLHDLSFSNDTVGVCAIGQTVRLDGDLTFTDLGERFVHGTYSYSIIAEGQIMETRQMIHQR